jgi:hypothetical protein
MNRPEGISLEASVKIEAYYPESRFDLVDILEDAGRSEKTSTGKGCRS